MAFYGIENWRSVDFEIIDCLFNDFIPKRKDIYIFGTGNIGKAFYYYLREMNICVSGFIKSDISYDNNNILFNLPIWGVEDFMKIYKSGTMGIVMAVSEVYYDEILPKLRGCFEDVFFLGKSKHYMTSHIQEITTCCFHIVSHCNLSCFSCMAGSPVAEKRFQSLEVFKKDIQLFHKVIDNRKIDICVTGGEALLHPKCIDFLKTARKEFKNNKIKLLTNGIALQEKESYFGDEIAENNITIWMTKYPISYPNYQRIIDETNKRNIELAIQFQENDKESCYNPLFEERKSPKADYVMCPYFNYPRVMEGRLYPCCLMPEIPHLNSYFHTNIELRPEDSLDLERVSSFEEVMKFMSRRPPGCDYCDLRHRKTLGKWKCSKKEKVEWFS